jgi:hypothetical protein
MAKSKSMKGSDGGRKLADDHGRKKKNRGGEPEGKKGATRVGPANGSFKQS